MYVEIANKILEAPWLFRALTGHALPLLVALYCLWSLRGYARTTAVLPFLATMAASGWMEWVTAKAVRTPVPGGLVISVQLLPGVAVLFALVTACFATKRVDWRAVWAGAFFPLYLVDVLCSQKVFGPSWADALQAVGGAGLLDGLLLVPAMAVAMNWGIARIVGLLRQRMRPV